MGGGRDKDGVRVYRRVNGKYERIDGKPIKHRQNTADLFEGKEKLLSATDRAQMNPLPQTGREVSSFLVKTMAIADLNNSSNSANNKISRTKRKLKDLVAKIMNGDITTENGGFVFNEHEKNGYFLKYNDLPDFDAVMKQIKPQIKPENLREIIPSGINSTIDGNTESSNLFVYEVNVTNNQGEKIKTYVKLHPFHAPDGKPYTVLVSIHKPKGGRITDKTTPAQKG